MLLFAAKGVVVHHVHVKNHVRSTLAKIDRVDMENKR